MTILSFIAIDRIVYCFQLGDKIQTVSCWRIFVWYKPHANAIFCHCTLTPFLFYFSLSSMQVFFSLSKQRGCLHFMICHVICIQKSPGIGMFLMHTEIRPKKKKYFFDWTTKSNKIIICNVNVIHKNWQTHKISSTKYTTCDKASIFCSSSKRLVYCLQLWHCCMTERKRYPVSNGTNWKCSALSCSKMIQMTQSQRRRLGNPHRHRKRLKSVFEKRIDWVACLCFRVQFGKKCYDI